jgi:hypothetical protein
MVLGSHETSSGELSLGSADGPGPGRGHELGSGSKMRLVDGDARTITIVFCAEILLLLLIGTVHTHSAAARASLALAASVVLAFAVRSGYSYVLILEPFRVTARTLTHTRSWRYDELRSAEGFSGSKALFNHSFIVLQPKLGRPYSFTTLGEDPDMPSHITRVEQEINTRISCSGTVW